MSNCHFDKCISRDNRCQNAVILFNFFEDVALHIDNKQVPEDVIEHQFKYLFLESYIKCEDWIEGYVMKHRRSTGNTLKDLYLRWSMTRL